ncbi:hypothetical protein N8745_00375 [Candidatus Pelagibacter sp.]|nr:hypothetical protein [Candidatus Pelagibacter sp.]
MIFKILLVEFDGSKLKIKFIINEIKKIDNIQKIGSLIKKKFLFFKLSIIKINEIKKNIRLIAKFPKIKVMGNSENKINNNFSILLS